MTFYRHHILMAAGIAVNNEDGAVRPVQSGTKYSLIQPLHRMDFGKAKELTWVLGVEGTIGSPTAWSFTPRFQYRVENTFGFQYSNPRWFDLDEVNIASDIVEGVSFNPFTNTGGAPATQKRTLRNFPVGVRLVIDDFTITGGTNPALKLSLNVTEKG